MHLFGPYRNFSEFVDGNHTVIVPGLPLWLERLDRLEKLENGIFNDGEGMEHTLVIN